MAKPAMRLTSEKDARPIPRKIGFTVAAINGITCPPGKDRVMVYDLKTPALAIRVTSKGARTFWYYRFVNGRPVKIQIGKYPPTTIDQARRKAQELSGEYATGNDPAADRRAVRDSTTIGVLWEKYRDEHLKLRATNQTLVTDNSRYKTCLERWQNRRASSITPEAVRDLHAELARGCKRKGATGKTTANRAIQLLRRMLTWARIEPNPCKGAVDYFHETQRERFLHPDELPKFFEALEAYPDTTMVDLFKVALFTGARRSNTQAMKWADVNLTRATWTVPAGQSKNKRQMEIHLPAAAIGVLKSRQDNGSDYVFSSHGKTGHVVEPKKAWAIILKSAGLKDVHFHDLRRTLGSWQASGGASLSVIGKSLGHQHHGTTAIYARMNLEPVRESVNDAVSRMLATIPVPTMASAPAQHRSEIREGSD